MADKPTLITAGELHAGHIDSMMRFRIFDDAREVTTVIDAELRQINHNGSETTLHYGVGAEKEITMDHDHPILLNPSVKYDEPMSALIVG